MAKVILVDNMHMDSNVGEVLVDGVTDEQAREAANKYNEEHYNSGSRFAKIILDEKRIPRRSVAFM